MHVSQKILFTADSVASSMWSLTPSLPVLFLMLWWSWLPYVTTAQPVGSPRAIDALLQDYAFRALVRPKTGTVYDGTVPSNLTGIQIAALRLRNGSLRMRGFKSYKEFEIPVGVVVEPYVRRLVLVYQNLGNWSNFYYPLPGHIYLAPVLGLLAYDGANLSATNLQDLEIRASLDPILIHFSDVKPVPDGVVSKCVTFDLMGSINFVKVSSDNTCSAVQQGHFALVAEATAPTPAPSPSPVSPPPPGENKNHKKKFSKGWAVLVGVVGGLLLLVFLGLLILCGKHKHKKHIQRMERVADNDETLRMTSVGRLRVPVATETRTHPSSQSFMAE